MSLICAPNFRDLGGRPAADGRRMRLGRVFRSEVILRPEPADIDTLGRHSIQLVLDLRSTAEAETHPNDYLRGQGAEIVHFNVGTDVRAKGGFWDQLATDSSPAAVQKLLQKAYRAIPMAVAPALRFLFERLEADAPPTLLHCAAGKDRTGIASALLLHALGTPFDEIEEDDRETRKRRTEPVRARGAAVMRKVAGGELSPESLDMLLGVRRDFLGHAFSWMTGKYGNPDEFLRAEADLSDRRRARIRECLLESA